MKLKKIIAVVTAAAMVMGSSISVFADTATGSAVNATGTDGRLEGTVNKKIYQVKLPTSTQVENYFGGMILDPETLLTETQFARYSSDNPSSPMAVGFDDDASGASVLFRKEVDVSGDALTSTELKAVTYSATSATLEAVNLGTVPVTITAVTKVVSMGAVDSENSSAYRNINLFKDTAELTAATLPGVLFTVTGVSVDRSGSTAASTNAVSAITGASIAVTSSAIASGSSTIIKAVTAAPVTAYAVTYSAIDHKYAYVVTGDAATSASVTGAASAGVSGLAVNADFEHFSKFTFVMAGKASKSEYKYWKYLTDAHPAVQILWEIEYDDEAEDRNSDGRIKVTNTGVITIASLTRDTEPQGVVLSADGLETISIADRPGTYTLTDNIDADGTFVCALGSDWLNYYAGKVTTVTVPLKDGTSAIATVRFPAQ